MVAVGRRATGRRGVPYGIAEVFWDAPRYGDTARSLGVPLVVGLLASACLLGLILIAWVIQARLTAPAVRAAWYWALVAASVPPLVALGGRLLCGTRFFVYTDAPWLPFPRSSPYKSWSTGSTN